MQTPILRKCNATKPRYVPATPRTETEPPKGAHWELVDLGICLLHYFSTEAGDGESSAVAVVEDSTGQLHVVQVRDVKFVDPHESLITPPTSVPSCAIKHDHANINTFRNDQGYCRICGKDW